MKKETSMFGKITKCVYCGKQMSFFVICDHEDRCHKKKKLCEGYGNCLNKGVITLESSQEKSRWCFDCFKRYKKEHPEIKIEVVNKLLKNILQGENVIVPSRKKIV